MATATVKRPRLSRSSRTRYVYFFGNGKAEGNGTMKAVLGSKGAGLAEMTNAGLPVPPGFTIQTEACLEYLRDGRTTPDVDRQTFAALERLEKLQGQQFGGGPNPLLVSVRSGARISMPGMMDTILNLGLNDKSVEALADKSGNPRFAYDSYRRLIQMFSDVVMDIPKSEFEAIFEKRKKEAGAKQDTDLDAPRLRGVVQDFKQLVKEKSGAAFPQDPREQLRMARDAVFRSWNTDRARHYRRINHIPDDLGTACSVQAMVFGNLGETSGTGVGFTRNPSTGEKEFYGEFLMNAQGEDVVAGIRTPVPISELQKVMPKVYDELRTITSRLEKHYKDMQDFEFTIQEGKLYMLQTRSGKRTGLAAVRIALDMVKERLIDTKTAIFRVEPNQLYDFLLPQLDEKNSKIEVLARGLPASPGAAVGQIVFTADEAVEKAGGQKKNPVILVRGETTPEDIHGMEVAVGILTSRGGMTSHAAVVTRGMGKCCVAGAGEISIDENLKEMRVKGQVFHAGDWISLDGTTGRVIKGKLATVPARPDIPELQQFMKWAEPFRDMKVRANADIPRDAIQARAFGAEGIGLCRTEHMFFAEDRIAHMRAMIMASDPVKRKLELDKLLPMQRSDFLGIFRAMDGFPVTIRLLDPPLHEFLPRRENLMADVAVKEAMEPNAPELDEMYRLLARVDDLHEINPMLGHRGCRLGITDPSISRMQARAIFEAAVEAAKEGIKVLPEVMIPLVSAAKEMANQAAIIRSVAEEVFREKKKRVNYMVGTMVELPRAAVCADDIAQEAEFFSFGTNDLTQTTFGFSRDDINKFLPSYLEQGIFKHDPFAVLDQGGVGKLMKIACELGRRTRPELKIGICGEHGGEPSSVQFCYSLGMDYVSCSPFRVLTARLAAAQAGALKTMNGKSAKKKNGKNGNHFIRNGKGSR